MKNKNKLIGGITSAAGGMFIRIITNIILLPVLIRCLGPSDYGFYLFLLSLADLLSAMDVGLTTGLIHRISHYHAINDEKQVQEQLLVGQWLYLFLGMLIICFGFIFYPYIPALFNLTTAQKEIANWAFIIVFIDAAFHLFGMYLQSILKAHCLHNWTNIVDTGQAILLNGLSVLLLGFGFSLIHILLLRVIITVGLNIFLLYKCLRVEPNTLQAKWQFPLQTAQNLFGISIYAMIRNISGLIAHKIDDFVIAAFLSMSEVGLFGLVMRIFSQISQLYTRVSEICFPMFTRMTSLSEHENSKFFFLRMSSFLHFLASLMILITLGNFSTIMTFIGSGTIELHQANELALIVAVITWSGAIQMPASSYLFASGMHRFQTISALVTSLLNFLLSIVLVKYIGLLGVALGTLFPHFIQHQFVTIVIACRRLNISFREYLTIVHCKCVPALICLIVFLYLPNMFRHEYDALGKLFPFSISIIMLLLGTIATITIWVFMNISGKEIQLIFEKAIQKMKSTNLSKERVEIVEG